MNVVISIVKVLRFSLRVLSREILGSELVFF